MTSVAIDCRTFRIPTNLQNCTVVKIDTLTPLNYILLGCVIIMTQEQQERAKILMQAALDILNKCDEGIYVKNVMEVTAIWDNTECDGYCLKEELGQLMDEVNAP